MKIQLIHLDTDRIFSKPINSQHNGPNLRSTTRLPSDWFRILVIVSITSCFVTPAIAEVSKLDAMKSREFLQKGNGHLNRLEFQKALEAYTESLLCDPDNRVVKDNIVLTHNNWGIWYFQKQKYKEAREEWDQALKLNPRDANARQNLRVLQATLSRQGLQSDDGSQKSAVKSPKPDFPPSQVIILTPGLKQSATSAAPPESSTGAAASASPAPSRASSSSGDPFSSESSSGGTGGAAIISSPASSTPASSTPSAPSVLAAPKNIPNSVPVVTTPAPVSTPSSTANTDNPSKSSQSSATAGGSQGDNIEEQMGQIELKIYGRKQESMPIMKRLEKLEIDTHGQKKSGTIKERIDTLRKSYGI